MLQLIRYQLDIQLFIYKSGLVIINASHFINELLSNIMGEIILTNNECVYNYFINKYYTVC